MKITKKHTSSSAGGKKRKGGPPPLDTAKPVQLPVEILYQLAEAGGVRSHDLMSSLNVGFQKSLQQPVFLRRALLHDGIPSRVVPNLTDADISTQLTKLLHAERFLSQRTNIDLPPGSLQDAQLASGTVCVTMSTAGSTVHGASLPDATVHLFCWSASPPAWKELSMPAGEKNIVISQDGLHVLIHVSDGERDHLGVFDVRGEPKLVSHQSTEPGGQMSDVPSFLSGSQAILFHRDHADGTSDTIFLPLKEPYEPITTPQEVALSLSNPFSSDTQGIFLTSSTTPPALIDLASPQRKFFLSGAFAAALDFGGLFLEETKEHLIALDGHRMYRAPLADLGSLPSITHFPGFAMAYSEGAVACLLEGPDGRQHLQLFGVDGHPLSATLSFDPGELCEQVDLRGRRALIQTTAPEPPSEVEEDESTLWVSRAQAVLFSDQTIKKEELTDAQFSATFAPNGGAALDTNQTWLLTHESEEPVRLGTPYRQNLRAMSLQDLESFSLSVEANSDDLKHMGMDPGQKRVLVATPTGVRIVPLVQ